MPLYYIHIGDPGFEGAGEDFPFGRRLGPFLTKAEAVNQAVSDVAGGTGSILGIYTEAESEKTRDGGDGNPASTTEDIDSLAADERARLEKQRADQLAAADPQVGEQWAALMDSITDPEVRAIAEQLRGRTM